MEVLFEENSDLFDIMHSGEHGYAGHYGDKQVKTLIIIYLYYG